MAKNENKTADVQPEKKTRTPRPLTTGSVLTMCIDKVGGLQQKDQIKVMKMLNSYFEDDFE